MGRRSVSRRAGHARYRKAIRDEHEAATSRKGTAGVHAQKEAKAKAKKFERSFRRKQSAAQKREARER
jgi:hypothetical protein